MFFLNNRGTSVLGDVFISYDLEYVIEKAPNTHDNRFS